MKRSAIAVLFALVFTAAVFGQTVVTSTAKTPPPAEDGEVVKISTTLIQLDLTVTDRSGKIIRDIRPDEIEIYENGRKQTVQSFSFVSSMREDAPAEPEPEPGPRAPGAVPIPTPPPSVRPDQVRRTFALVVDDLTLSFESAYHTRRALKKFVDEQMLDGDLVAIIRTGAGVGALQQFTADKRILYAAIERVKWNPLGNGRIGAFAPIEPSLLEQAQAAGDTSVTEEDLREERSFNADFDDFRKNSLATGTLGALRYVVEGMRDLPGRKSVILFSEGFSLIPSDPNGFSDSGRVVDAVKKLIDSANRASVVFYNIDPRGLQYTGPTAADRLINTSPQAYSRVLSDRGSELYETQSGLKYLAEETGGFAYVNQNDMNWALRKVLSDQSYYLVAYEPDSETFDPKRLRYNNIAIKVTRKDAQVRARSGFFNVAEEKIAKAAPAQMTPVQQIQTALLSPFAVNEISLSLNSIYGNDPAHGNYVRSLVHIPASDLRFTDGPNGTKQADFSILAVSFGDNGVAVDSISKDFTFTANERVFQKLLRDGFVYHFAYPLKKPGPYQFRVALRDKQGGTVGSASQFIDIPNLKKGRHAVSGIVLQYFNAEQWKTAIAAAPGQQIDDLSSPMNDTALRRFKTGGVLQYSFETYNARVSSGTMPKLSSKIRVFRDGKIVLDGAEIPVDTAGQTDPMRIRSGGAISLQSEMPPGEYILQIVVMDKSAKEKRRLATQFIQFELSK